MSKNSIIIESPKGITFLPCIVVMFLDNFVSGGLTEGRGVLETAIKEAAEEAGLTDQLATGQF